MKRLHQNEFISSGMISYLQDFKREEYCFFFSINSLQDLQINYFRGTNVKDS